MHKSPRIGIFTLIMGRHLISGKKTYDRKITMVSIQKLYDKINGYVNVQKYRN